MSDDDPALEEDRRREADRWLAVASEDLRVAQTCLAMEPPALGAAAYHCQQAAEKVLKGMLVAAGVDFRRTHDMDELADLAAAPYPDCRAIADATRRYTVWGFAYRYPGAEDIADLPPSAPELRDALDIIDRLAGRLRQA
jgi:HEPN domain-containing protein